MVAYNLAKVDARVRFPLPAPGTVAQEEGYFVNRLTLGRNPQSPSPTFTLSTCGYGIGVVP